MTGRKDPTLEEAIERLEELNEKLSRIQQSPLVVETIESVDGNFCFIGGGNHLTRIIRPSDVNAGDKVLVDPQTKQIVEKMATPKEAKSKYSPIISNPVSWNDIGGLDAAKRDMIEAIELPHKERELFAFYKKRPIKGILLSGPPGCGKTMLGKAAATALSSVYGKKACNTGFIYIKAPELLNSYVGETERAIRKVFSDARDHMKENGYPATIFIDEADAILATRGSGRSSISSTVVPSFLTEMDGMEDSASIVILATNRPDILDPAIVRDGRCDRKISVHRPLKSDATKIALGYLKNVPSKEKEKIANFITAEIYNEEYVLPSGNILSDIVSGAMIANIIDLSVSSAIHRDIEKGTRTGVTIEDASNAIKRIVSQSLEVQHSF